MNEKGEGKMNNVAIEDDMKIENLIYEVRGVQVIFDRELSVTK